MHDKGNYFKFETREAGDDKRLFVKYSFGNEIATSVTRTLFYDIESNYNNKNSKFFEEIEKRSCQNFPLSWQAMALFEE